MSQRTICAACGGENPEQCLVCKGTGFDRPPLAVRVDNLNEVFDEASMNENIEHLLLEAEDVMREKLVLIAMRTRKRFYSFVLFGGIATLGLAFLAFLIGWQRWPLPQSMVALSSVIVLATLYTSWWVWRHEAAWIMDIRINREDMDAAARRTADRFNVFRSGGG